MLALSATSLWAFLSGRRRLSLANAAAWVALMKAMSKRPQASAREFHPPHKVRSPAKHQKKCTVRKERVAKHS